MARFDKRETVQDKITRRNRQLGIRGKGYITGTVDTKDVENLMNRLIELDKGEGKKAMKHACRMALEVIDEETREEAEDLPLRTPARKGWRQTLKKKTAFTYKLRRVKTRSFWFYSAVNYRKPQLRISHLVEKGFKHVKAGWVSGHWYRKDAFREKRATAMKTLELNLLYGLDKIRKGEKIPNITQWRKGAPRG